MEWRIIPAFPDYEVSEFGDVRRCGKGKSNACVIGKVLRPTRCGPIGYKAFTLFVDCAARRLSAHRAVALAFLGPPPSQFHQAAHFDGNAQNNHFSNLRWATPKENNDDCVRHGTRALGERAGPRKFTLHDVVKIRELYSAGLSQERIAAAFSTSQSHVGRIVRRELWRHVQ